MLQTTTKTANPAGSPKVTEKRYPQPYSRDAFVSDLKKVARKTDNPVP